MNRPAAAAIVIPVVAAAAIGTFVLAGNHGSRPRQALAASSSRSHWRRYHIDRFVGVAPADPLLRSVRSFSQITGVNPVLVEIYTGFHIPFPQAEARRIVRQGSEPLVQWNPQGAPVKKIDNGDFNTYIRSFALQVKAFGYRIILSFGHEMNGSWSQWSRPYTTPRQFIAAWRLIHNIFKRNNVRNVTWSWDPSHGGSSARQWWPGRKYVNRIGIDGYFRHHQTFKQIFGRQLRIIRSLTSKPVYIAETAVARGPGQDRQIEGIFNGVRHYHLAGFVWFDIDRLEVWRLEGRRGAIRAFRRCTTFTIKCP